MEGQSNPSFEPSVMKTHIHLTDVPAQEEDLLQRYRERTEKLSQQDRVSKFCMDAGFLNVVEIGQYFKRRTSPSSSTKTILIGERIWTDIEPQDYSLKDCPVSKKLINLLRHGSLPPVDDGAIEFWR